MGRPVSAHKKRLTKNEGDTVREDYVKKMRDNYPLIIRTLMHDLIVSVDKNGDIVFANDAAVEFWDKPSEELIGTPFSDYIYPEDVGRSQRNLQEMVKSKGQVKGSIIRVESPQGTRTVAWNVVAIFDDDGNYVGAQATGKDLTDFLRTEEELKQSRSHFRRLFEVMVDPIVIIDLTGNLLELSQSAEEILEFPREELVGKNFLESAIVPDESKAVMTKNLENFKRGKLTPPYTIELVPEVGRKLLYELTPARIMYRGQPAILVIFRNLTGQKLAEEKLQASEERFNYFMYNAPEAIWVQDVVGNFIDGNKKAEELTGYKKEELIGKNLLELLVQPDSIPKIMEDFKATMFGELSGPLELEMVRKDGSLVTVEATTIPVKRDGNVEIIGVTRDVTERKKTESALKESEEKFRTIFDGSTDGIVAADPKTHKFVFANARIYELTGYSVDELSQLGVADIVPPENLDYAMDQFQKQFEGKVSITRNMAILRKDKTVVYCDISSKFMEIGNSQYLIGFFRDVTERKEFEDILKESEEKFRTIFEGASDGIAAIDPTTMKVVFANPALGEILGFPMDKVIGSTLLDYIPKEEIAATMEKFQNGVSGKQNVFRDLTVLRQDNTRIYVDITSKFLTFGNQRYLISFVRDVTEQKRAHEALLESEKKYREMINAMNDTVWVVDFDGKFVDVNDAAVKVSGYSRDELLSMGLTDIDNALTPEQIKGLIKGMKTDETQVFETEHTTKGGRTFPVEISSSRVTYQGKPAILSIARDITERKKAEEALRSSEEAAKRLLEFQNKIIDTATVWVNLIDLKGNVILWNRAAELVSGYSRKEIIGHNSMWSLLYPDPDYRAKIFSIGKEINEGKRIEDFYSTIKCKDGTLKTISWYSTSVRDEKGETAGSISIGIDVTEREKAQQAKNNALALLKQSNKELESYTYVVSHDLKAPLRTIRSFGSFILEDYGDKLDETGQDYLNRMITAASHMDHMIEDLLVLSRVGRKFTEIKKVDLNKLLGEILSDLEATIKEHKTKVVVDKLPVLSAQKVWMRQLFMNFISNALKFNESKSPKIEVLYEERDNDHLFKVRDNGIGIEEKYQERIFNLFERAPTEKKYEGTGAGLSICKKIVEHYGGKIWVESTPGKGSTFMFTLPRKTKILEKGEQEN